jgi:RNA polymerase-binding transcription factor DksA
MVNGPGDAADVSVDSDTLDVSLGLMANERQMLAQVTAALKRIDQGTFGMCTICGKAIGKERLTALPYTPYCVDDARAMEGRADPLSTEGSAGVA